MVVLGAWMMVSPWVLEFSSISLAKWNALVVGLLLVLVNAWMIFDDPDAARADARAEKRSS